MGCLVPSSWTFVGVEVTVLQKFCVSTAGFCLQQIPWNGAALERMQSSLSRSPSITVWLLFQKPSSELTAHMTKSHALCKTVLPVLLNHKHMDVAHSVYSFHLNEEAQQSRGHLHYVLSRVCGHYFILLLLLHRAKRSCGRSAKMWTEGRASILLLWS